MNKEARIAELLKKWMPRLGLQDWIINVTIHATEMEGDDRCEAAITEDLKYHNADLEIYKPFWLNDPIHQEKDIIHELTHLLTCRLHPYLAPLGDDALEETVQTIAMQFFNAYKEEEITKEELTPAMGFHTDDE